MARKIEEERDPKRRPEISDRLAARQRPEVWPVMHQSWDKLLFLHWEVPVDALRKTIPEPLDFFLLERYSLYTADDLSVFRCRYPSQTLATPANWRALKPEVKHGRRREPA